MSVKSLYLREWLFVGVVIVFLVAMSALSRFGSSSMGVVDTFAESHLVKDQKIAVRVSGAVVYPDTYLVAKGSSVGDLLTRAVPSRDADLSKLKSDVLINRSRSIKVPVQIKYTVFLLDSKGNKFSAEVPKGTQLSELIDFVDLPSDVVVSIKSSKRKLRDGEVVPFFKR